MTRIIAGRAGSLALDVPGSGTRPTSDRVRESLFGALESADLVRGSAVLDLYAGSGALGLEAASRGAASVDLVERSAGAAAVVRRNVAKVAKAVGSDATLRVHAMSARMFLRGVAGPFDLVFLDPPYDIDEDDLDAVLDALPDLLAPGAAVIVERASRSPRPSPPQSLVHVREKRYGDTALWWLALADQPVAESQSR
ncbi:MAG TPA: 16S rRNA (guanine(966)-N(2))-methyltransferase RsmD [Microbacterium sp.]|nr:16S rRNA (guanine(966)-N(2))-methyltransferase RsmD [Microbacterium sp.]